MINKQNLEASIAEIEKQLAEMKEQLNSLNSNGWQPKLNERYFWVNVFGNVVETSKDSRKDLKHRVFKTRQEAQAYAEYVRAEEILKQQIAVLNDGWIPDWTNIDKTKHSFSYSIRGKCVLIESAYTAKFHNSFMYLKSRALAENLIKTHSKELKIYLLY